MSRLEGWAIAALLLPLLYLHGLSHQRGLARGTRSLEIRPASAPCLARSGQLGARVAIVIATSFPSVSSIVRCNPSSVMRPSRGCHSRSG